MGLMLNAKTSKHSHQVSRKSGHPTTGQSWSMMHRAGVAMSADQEARDLLHGIVNTNDSSAHLPC